LFSIQSQATVLKYLLFQFSTGIFLLQVDIDFEKEPIGTSKDGKKVYFRDIWPSNEEIADVSY